VIVQAVFNLSSDMMLLAVGFPLILKARLDLKRKIALVAIFGLGFFVILAAILSKYYNFTYNWTTIYMVWYIREASTAIYVANIPSLWPLFARVFKFASHAGSNDSSGFGKQFGSSTHHTGGSELSRIRRGPKHMTDTMMLASVTDHSSQERINNPSEGQVEVETRVSFTVEDRVRAFSTSTVPKYDVENYGESTRTVTISAGGGKVR
jgi:hypothetical protein